MAKTVFDIGEKFEHLTVIAELPKDARSNRIYLVRCSCGTEKSVPGRNLRPEVTVSCGCHQRATVLKRLLKHGDTSRKTRTAEYRCWAHIKDRCFNPITIALFTIMVAEASRSAPAGATATKISSPTLAGGHLRNTQSTATRITTGITSPTMCAGLPNRNNSAIEGPSAPGLNPMV